MSSMNDELHEKYKRLCALPFPKLGKVVGDFVLWDTLLMGIADRVQNSEAVGSDQVPLPDTESRDAIEFIKAKQNRTIEEEEFYEYFLALDEIRRAIMTVIAEQTG